MFKSSQAEKKVTVLSSLSIRYRGWVGCLIKASAPMHESQSTACVCFIYSLVTRSLKRKKKKRQESSIQISMASLEQDCKRERNKEGIDKSVCMCMCGENTVLESG